MDTKMDRMLTLLNQLVQQPAAASAASSPPALVPVVASTPPHGDSRAVSDSGDASASSPQHRTATS